MDQKELEKGRGKDKDISYKMDVNMLMVSESASVSQAERIYTYEDYLNWPEDERVELIDGQIYDMAAPTKRHQELLGRLYIRFGNYLDGKSCDVYFAPFDVRIDLDLGKDSVVQPDLVVICDDEKLDEQGLNGAPDLVIEVLSKSTASRDRVVKYHKYLAAGVKEYWLVDPVLEEVVVNVLKEHVYEAQVYLKGDVIKPTILAELHVDVTDLFKGRESRERIEVERAREEERIKIAKSLLRTGVAIEEVAKHTGLSEQLLTLALNQ